MQIASKTFSISPVRLTNGDQLNLYNKNDRPLPVDCDRSCISYFDPKLWNHIVSSDPE